MNQQDFSHIPLPGAEPETRVPADTGRVATKIETAREDFQNILAGLENSAIRPGTQIQTSVGSAKQDAVAYLLAQGKTKKEIAQLLDLTPATVNTTAAQPYVKKKVKEILSDCGGNAVTAFLRGQVQSSLDTLVEIRDNPQARAADRLASANAILDRALGKPTQHIETAKVDMNQASLEITTLAQQIRENEAKLRARGISLSSKS